ncbi:3-oxoacyl-[acyl-carrier-protein] reductase, chloroplastic-like [Aricia agestis]|uniref:3-oxoacyl-[acyl-carrier-protein] reductase, chloroplastic-like n=1 Tax=Aricia agestis TaxID=91739 RepID=UPI001C20A87B|nr:3-oxoacyl-[acyl-carrier-protein] reductase, chloroplastic-like [Aricia agestis]
MSFANKVVLVVGASSGIGAATAVAFAKEGAHVVLVGRNEEKLKSVSAQCEKVGKKPLIIKADISKDAEAKMVVSKTIEKYGTLDVLINNAGIVRMNTITSETAMNTYDEIMNTNLRSAVLLTSLSAAHLIKSKGNIVNVSSVTAQMAVPKSFAYAVSKAGLSHFTRQAAVELAAAGVRVNAVSPGPVKTDIMANAGVDFAVLDGLAAKTLLKRMSEPEEVADLILFLASEKAKGITGSDFVTDNGALLTDKSCPLSATMRALTMSFANKVVLVVGASSGIGAATAVAFAKEGAHVVLVGRNEEKLKSVSAQCEKVGKKPLIIKADISKDAEAKMVVSKTIAKYGTLDVLINNAGIIRMNTITSETAVNTYDEIMNTNLRSAVLLTSLSAAHLIKSKGNIVNVSSVSAQMALPGTFAYAVSKAGLSHFTRQAAVELAAAGVRVNAVSPGPVKTDIMTNAGIDIAVLDGVAAKTLLKRMSEPEEVADLILFLASEKAKGITGSDFVTDNGGLLMQG